MNNRLISALAVAATLAVACGDTTYVFDDVTVGDDEAGRTPRERSNAQFIKAIYADLIGRSTEAYSLEITAGDQMIALPLDEQQTLEGFLGGLGDSRAARNILVAGMVDHQEVDIPEKADVTDVEGFITDQFRTFLGRDPSIYELQTFTAEWASDASVNPKTVIRALIASREYQTF
jgi:hypothetical protein